MSIDLSSVDWSFTGLMTALAFVTALLGSLIALRNRFVGAIIAAILFAIGFVAWNYYPHNFGLPILKATGPDGVVTPASAAAPAPATSATPAPSSNPVTTLPPPPAGGGMAPNTSH
jgi:hypothetical protein